MSDLRFFQVTEVEKREKGKFLRPRLRNVPRGSLFSTEVCNLEILKSNVDTFFRKQWQEQLLK